jgi:hypothetical protein
MAPDSRKSIPADVLACAIDVHVNLGIDELRASYNKIAQAKKLAKDSPPRLADKPIADATMGVIFSADSNIPLETIAEELEDLNKGHSHQHWVDLVIVLSRGIINYVCQFP